MALASDPCVPEIGATGFECADGDSSVQPPSGKNELSRSKKGALWCAAITVTFGLSAALGFSVIGPLVAKHAIADSQDAGKAVAKFAFRPPIAAVRHPRGDRLGARRHDTKMGLFGLDVPNPFDSLESARFVTDDTYAVNKATGYVCQTPDVLEVHRYDGAKKGSARVQYTVPGMEDQPQTLELMRTNQDDKNPRYGAVKVPTPFEPPLESPMMMFRVVLGELKEGTASGTAARKAGLKKGDIVRAMSAGDGMHIMDGKTVGDFQSHMRSNPGEMTLVIERSSISGRGPWDGFDPPSGGYGARVGPDLKDRLQDLAKKALGEGEAAPNLR